MGSTWHLGWAVTRGANRQLFPLGGGGGQQPVGCSSDLKLLGAEAQPGRSGLWLLDSVAQGPGKGAKNSWRQLSPRYIWQRNRRL